MYESMQSQFVLAHHFRIHHPKKKSSQKRKLTEISGSI